MYRSLAAAFVRGRRSDAPALDDASTIAWGCAQGLRLHKFKRTSLPRVQRVIGWLRGLAPETLLDVGPGRGVALWPLLEAFPDLRVVAVEQHPIRVRDLKAVAGQIGRLEVIEGDATSLPQRTASPPCDGATLLEVLEHVDDPMAVARAVLGCVERFAIVSVPSQPDDNPDHVRLFTDETLEGLLREAGAVRVQSDRVRGHLLALAWR